MFGIWIDPILNAQEQATTCKRVVDADAVVRTRLSKDVALSSRVLC